MPLSSSPTLAWGLPKSSNSAFVPFGRNRVVSSEWGPLCGPSASSSASLRHRNSGTSLSRTGFSCAGTPAENANEAGSLSCDRCIARPQIVGMTDGAALLEKGYPPLDRIGLRNLGCGLAACAETGENEGWG